MKDEKRETFNLNEAARILGISRPTLRRYADEGKIPVIRVGTRVLVPRQYIDTLFEQSGFPRGCEDAE